MASNLPQSAPRHVAIIGAGPAGLTLALALSKHSIHSTIHEARPAPAPAIALQGNGVALSPNALRPLDRLDVLPHLRPLSYPFEASCLVDEQGNVLDRHYYGHERRFGYPALRVRRGALVREMLALLPAELCDVRFGECFVRVVDKEGDDGANHGRVKYEIEGRGICTADMLIGADGIRSSVRRLLDDRPLQYGGLLGLMATVPRANLAFPSDDFPRAAAVRGRGAALLLVPEDPDATTSMAAVQVPHRELSREELAALEADASAQAALLKRGYEGWGVLGRSIVDAMCAEAQEGRMLLWPFYTAPRLDAWHDRTRRILLVGDAAHAVPPSSGQGVSQAVEDACALARLLGASVEGKVGFAEAVDFWFRWRESRVARLEDLVRKTNIKRLPEEERKKFTDVREEDLDGVQTGENQYAWLFKTDLDQEIDDWIARQK